MYRILILLVFSINLSFSQSKNDYQINKKIKVDKIELEIHTRKKSSKSNKTLTNITLYRENDSISYFCKYYDYDTISHDYIFEKWRFCENSTEISTDNFDEFVSNLKTLNVNDINSSTRYVSCGAGSTTYTLIISGSNHTISFSTNYPKVNTKERGLTNFLTYCERIIKLENL